MMDASQLLPVSVITGFLGSGKTTLLNKLLHHPDMARSAVVINEFGEIGIDHDLVESASDDIILMTSGCLCCTIRGDLIDTLKDLYVRSVKGEIPEFDRLLVETTGLADPAPILHTLMSDPFLIARYRLDGVIATVDAAQGAATLDNHQESVKQAAVADRLVLTKSDITSTDTIAKLRARLAKLNPGAPIHVAAHGEIDPALLFDAGLYDPKKKTSDVRRWLREEAYKDAKSQEHGDGHGHHHDVNRHDENIRAFCIYLDEPRPWQQFATWLEMLPMYRGNDLLRIKGIPNVVESE